MGKSMCACDGEMCAALLVGVAFGVVGGAAIYASAYPIFQSDNWAAWAAAFGTFSAAGVALYLGLAEQRKAVRQRTSTTQFCRQVARKDLFNAHCQLESVLSNLELIECNLQRSLNRPLDAKHLEGLHKEVIGRFQLISFDTYEALARWLPVIDEDVALALVRIERAIDGIEARASNFLHPLSYKNDLSRSLVASCCKDILAVMKPMAEDLNIALLNPSVRNIVPNIETAMKKMKGLSRSIDPVDDDPESFGNPRQGW